MNEKAIGCTVIVPGLSLKTANPQVSYSGRSSQASAGRRKRSSRREKSFFWGTKDASKSPTWTTSRVAAAADLSVPSPKPRQKGFGGGKPDNRSVKKSG